MSRRRKVIRDHYQRLGEPMHRDRPAGGQFPPPQQRVANQPVVQHQVVITQLVHPDGNAQVQVNTGATITGENMSELIRMLGTAMSAAAAGLAQEEAKRVQIHGEAEIPASTLHMG